MTDTTRDDFEAWARSFRCSFKTTESAPYSYCNTDVQFIWRSWQASRESLATEQGKRQPLTFVRERAQLEQEWCELRALTEANKRQPLTDERRKLIDVACEHLTPEQAAKLSWDITEKIVDNEHDFYLGIMGTKKPTDANQQELSYERLRAMYEEATAQWVVTEVNPYLRFARAIEAAHGITATPQGNL